MDNQIKSPRIVAACYFLCLALIATAFIQVVLYSLGLSELIPLWMSFTLSMPVAFGFGALYGKAIIEAEPPYKLKSFLLGMCLVLTALPVYDLGLLFLLKPYHPEIYRMGDGLKDYAIIYLFILIYSFVLIGSWLSILGGVAAVYLRHRFVSDFIKFLKAGPQ